MKSIITNKTKSLTSPVTPLDSSVSGFTLSDEVFDVLLWEKPYIDSKRNITVNGSTFGFQVIIQGRKKRTVVRKSFTDKFYALCRIKVYPKAVMFKNEVKVSKFIYKPIKQSSYCIKSFKNGLDKTLKISWKEGTLKYPVLKEEELIPEEILQKCICQLESFIKDEYLPEINDSYDLIKQDFR